MSAPTARLVYHPAVISTASATRPCTSTARAGNQDPYVWRLVHAFRAAVTNRDIEISANRRYARASAGFWSKHLTSKTGYSARHVRLHLLHGAISMSQSHVQTLDGSPELSGCDRIVGTYKVPRPTDQLPVLSLLGTATG